MGVLKKVWFTNHGSGLEMMSLESSDPTRDFPDCMTKRFPKEPDEKHPLRRVMAVGLFDQDDLLMIKEAIEEVLEEMDE